MNVFLDDGFGQNADAQGDVLLGIENVVGSSFGDFLNGDGLANRLDGGRDIDIITGGGGGGGGGGDTLLGGGAGDEIFGGAGAELINGGGSDILSYQFSALGVNVNLSTGLVSGGDAAGDTVTGVESLFGSSGGDVLAGSAGATTSRATAAATGCSASPAPTSSSAAWGPTPWPAATAPTRSSSSGPTRARPGYSSGT